MERLRAPSLNGLRAFATLAEMGSYTKAAARLNVTHAAVSQQVRALETFLDVSLVIREGRGIRLTAEGDMLARDLIAGFRTISRGVERLVEVEEARPVQVTTSPAFATEWLMPRITQFQQANPDVLLMLNPTSEVVPLKPGGIDLAVRYREGGPSPDWNSTPVLVSDMIVIGSAELLAGWEVSDLGSLAELPWLQELGTNEVSEWFSRHGISPTRRPMVTQMPGNLIMDAVRRGDGLTFTARAFFRKDIEAGRVVVLHTQKSPGTYNVVTNPASADRPAVRAFVKWLNAQAEVVAMGEAR